MWVNKITYTFLVLLLSCLTMRGRDLFSMFSETGVQNASTEPFTAPPHTWVLSGNVIGLSVNFLSTAYPIHLAKVEKLV